MNREGARKHWELIQAWKDGAEIEYWNVGTSEWNHSFEPTWNPYTSYRIKPEVTKHLRDMTPEHVERALQTLLGEGGKTNKLGAFWDLERWIIEVVHLAEGRHDREP